MRPRPLNQPWAAVAPRLYAQVAAGAPVALVFRRAPSRWWQLGRWDLQTGDYEPGAWLRGRLYPRRCDLSPDGALLLAFILKPTAPGFLEPDRAVDDTYVTLSKAPWLHALAAWREGSTWGRGYCFTGAGAGADLPMVLGEPDHGDIGPLRRRYGIDRYPVVQYAAERRRGWDDHPDSPPRDIGGPWDDRRSAILVKPSPGGDRQLVLRDQATARNRGIDYQFPAYRVIDGRGERDLGDAAWADWDHEGRLLVATHAGALEIRDIGDRDGRVIRSHDLARLTPDPTAAPPSARRW